MQIVFFVFSALVVFVGHILFFFATIGFLGLTNLKAKLILAVILFFLFASIILSSFLVHQYDNIVTRCYYIFSGFWLGILLNICLILLLILIIKSIGLIFGFSLSVLALKCILVLGVSLLSLWGMYNAYAPAVKEYEVYIKDLPEFWDNKTVVQISDVHLGPVYREKFFLRVINKINTLKPEAVFITGDLFDGMETEFSWLNSPFSKLQAPQGTYYSFGNHDLYLGFERTKNLLKENPVIVLDNKMAIVNGLQIIGINYSFNQDFDLEGAILENVGYTKELPSILLFHEPKNIALAKNAAIDLQLSGHTHRGQLFPFNFLASLAYKGYSYGLFQEEDFSLIVTSGTGTWGPAMRTLNKSEIVKITLKRK